MGDFNALRDEIKTNPRYAAAYARGSNSTLVRLLKQETGRTTPAQRTRQEVIDALAPFLRQLSVDEQGALELIIGSDTRTSPGLDFNKTTVVQSVKDLWQLKPGQNAVSNALDQVATRPQTFADTFGFATFSLNDVRETQRLDPDSHYSRYQRGEVGG